MNIPQAYRYVFIGPSAAKEPYGTKTGRSGNAEIHGLTEVTYESICYIAVIVHVSPCTTGKAKSFF